jgi:hypothetical protein
MHGDIETCTDLSAEQAAMKKFLVEYELPYVHLVRVGIQAKSEESAILIANQAFTDCTLWDNTPEMPLLYDDYEETGDSGDVLEFKVVGEYQEWHEPEVCVKIIERDAAARRACEHLIAAYECSNSASVREALFQSALEEAHVAMPNLSASTSSSNVTAGEAIPTVVAWLEGGIVQWMASDHPMRYLVLDPDTDGNDSMDVTMENGSIADVIRTSSTVLADHLPEWVTKLVEEVEGQ